jgi:lipopolysaccharide transport system ATP-binding protein
LTDVAIRVEGLSKRYRIGSYKPQSKTFAGAVGELVAQPVRNMRRLRSLSNFGENSTTRGDSVIWALKDVSFEVKQGEVLGIVGRNGSGKSTLLKVLSQITEPTSGRIAVHGRVGSLLEVGTGFHPELTGRENVYLNGAILGMTKKEIDGKFDEIVAFSGVEKFIDTPVKHYSSGMKVRLAFSVAAHLEPEVLLIDEVLAVGDAEFQQKCLGTMGRVASSGRTVLFVSHNLGAIQNLCDRATVLDRGAIVWTDTATAAVRHYLSLAASTATGMTSASSQYLSRDGAVRIDSAQVTTRGHYEPAGCGMGDPLEFEVRCSSSIQLHQVALGIGMDNALGERITTLHSTLSTNRSRPASTGPGDFSFRCSIQGLTLAPGRYSLKLSLESSRGAEVVADDAVAFEVLATQQVHLRNRQLRGVVFCSQDWDVIAGEPVKN